MPTSLSRTQKTKTAKVLSLLSRKAGADLATLQSATGWQAHLVRAALSRLRQAGHQITYAPPTKHGDKGTYRLAARVGTKP
ncbi:MULTISPECIES: DUF3489 domain-containing protein [unclassified Roseivivax]|uniref:DUF3489 domain-containing protein n=1 Tax=unclassified Roseivivax TaxID=2639302 RepID=UPI00126883FF